MKGNGDFINQLRDEICEGQKRRLTYIKTKLVFITGLLGLGAFSVDGSVDGSVNTGPLLYLLPLIAFIFDLYILGEDYGIKRAGVFIAGSPGAPKEEKLWEEGVPGARDKLSFLACPISTFASVIAATVGIIFSAGFEYNYLFYIWLGLALIFVVFPFIYNSYRERKLRVFSEKLLEQRMEYER